MTEAPPDDWVDLVLPDVEMVIAGVPADLVESEEECRARVRLSFLIAHVAAQPDDLEAAINVLRARAGGTAAANPFGPRVSAETFEAVADVADRSLAAGRLDLATVLSLLYESGSIAARQGRRLIIFLGLNAHVRRAIWEHGVGRIRDSDLGADRYEVLGRWLLLASEMTSLAIGEGYRATERELLARDAAARRAALEELLGAEPTTARAAQRLRRLAMRYGMDADATYRVAAILPSPGADPTPEEPGMDDTDLEVLAGRIDQLLRRRGSRTDHMTSGSRCRWPSRGAAGSWSISAPTTANGRGSRMRCRGSLAQERAERTSPGRRSRSRRAAWARSLEGWPTSRRASGSPPRSTAMA